MRERILTTITIFDSPLDYPGKFVARTFDILPGLDPIPGPEPLCVVDTLEEARAMVPPGMYPLVRDAGDHESVVETWI